MFGISFSELVLIGLVALLVLGPERLPGAARTAGMWIGRIKRSFNSVKMDIEREMDLEGMRSHTRSEPSATLIDRPQRTAAPQASTPLAAGQADAPTPHHPDQTHERPQRV